MINKNLLITHIIALLLIINLHTIYGFAPVNEELFDNDEIYHFQDIEGHLGNGVESIDEASPSNIYSWINGTLEYSYQEDTNVNGTLKDVYIVKGTSEEKINWNKLSEYQQEERIEYRQSTSITYLDKNNYKPIFEEDRIRIMEEDSELLVFKNDYKVFNYPFVQTREICHPSIEKVEVSSLI